MRSNGRVPTTGVIRGIVHCHTDLSYDSRVPLSELCASLRSEGFQFVALTEHNRGVTAERYADYVASCRRLSDDRFVAIPGLEVLCVGGVEIAGLGIAEIVEPGDPDAVIARIRALGGYAIWVHPLKRGRSEGDHGCDAIEVLNGKVDGTLAPNLELVDRVIRLRRKRLQVHAIFGLDLHGLDQPRCVWVECFDSEPKASSILAALRAGRFSNRVTWGSVPSSGKMALPTRISTGLLSCAARTWNSVLGAMPDTTRGYLHRLARPVIRWLRRTR